MSLTTPTPDPASSRAARQLGRLGGMANTDAQNRARKQNAQRAGRPRRVCIYCGEPVLGGHKNKKRDITCGAHGWRWQQQSAEPTPTVAPDPTLLPDLLKLITQIDTDPAVTKLRRRLQRAIDIGR